MECPRCSHRISAQESLTISNPFDFGCPRCVARLEVGPRGRLLMLASALGGTLAGKSAVLVWLTAGLGRHDFLFTFVVAMLALVLVWVRITLALCDVRQRVLTGAR